MSASKPQLSLTVVSDYICPFCYVGNARVNRLRERFDLEINWCLIEIHPETPAEGMPLERLGYPPDQWAAMNAHLEAMVREEGLPWGERDFTTNSRRALLLAEAVREREPERFPALHQALFEAYFAQGRNLGDQQVLRDLAATLGVSASTVEAAWGDEAYAAQLRKYLDLARLWQVSGVPTFIIRQQVLTGAVPFAQMEAAARAQADADAHA